MAVKNIISAIPIVTFTLTADDTYQLVGSLPQPCFCLRVINDNTDHYFISFDGVHDNDLILMNTTSLLPGVYAAQPNTYNAVFPKGLTIYAKGTSGDVIIIVGYYQAQGS